MRKRAVTAIRVGFAALIGAALWFGGVPEAAEQAGVQDPVAAVLGPQDLRIGPGSAATRTGLAICFAALDRADDGLLTQPGRLAVAGRCQGLARDVLVRTPTLGAAHQLLAEALRVEGDGAAALTEMEAGARLSPNSAWLWQRRFALAARWPAPRPPQVAQLAEQALAKLASRPQTRSWLARRFVDDAPARALIAASSVPMEDHHAIALRREIDRVILSASGARP